MDMIYLISNHQPIEVLNTKWGYMEVSINKGTHKWMGVNPIPRSCEPPPQKPWWMVRESAHSIGILKMGCEMYERGMGLVPTKWECGNSLRFHDYP